MKQQLCEESSEQYNYCRNEVWGTAAYKFDKEFTRPCL